MRRKNEYSHWEVDNGDFPPGWTKRMMKAAHEADEDYIGQQYSINGVVITVMRMNGVIEYDEEGNIVSVPTKHVCRAKIPRDQVTPDLTANAVVAKFAALAPPITITVNAVKQKQKLLVFDDEDDLNQHIYDHAEEYGETVV